jgi:hypothetical protein
VRHRLGQRSGQPANDGAGEHAGLVAAISAPSSLAARDLQVLLRQGR